MLKKTLLFTATYNEFPNIKILLNKINTLKTPLDILIIDEALSTGDAKFKEKSLNRIKELRSDDRALIIVSHAMGVLREICNDIAWLDKGTLVQRGEPNATIDAYQDFLQVKRSAASDEDV